MTSPSLSASPRRVVRAAVAPLLGEPRISTALTSQLLAGETVEQLDARADWVYVRGVDTYEGWTHVGYLTPETGDETAWHWSLGCVVREAHGESRTLPLGARVTPDAEVLEGTTVSPDALAQRFPATRADIARSATTLFRGASYLWGGITPWGVDCSGLVQRVARLHGVALPRDAWQQALVTDPVAQSATGELEPADLLFFSDREDRRITHVGMALGDGHMVHSALARGGVRMESLRADDPYMDRLRTQCTGVHRLRLPV